MSVLKRCCWFIVLCTSHCLWGSDMVWWSYCYVHYVVFFLVMQSPWRGRASWSISFNCLCDVFLLLMFCGSPSRCRGLDCSVWLWYFLIIFTCFLGVKSYGVVDIDYIKCKYNFRFFWLFRNQMFCIIQCKLKSSFQFSLMHKNLCHTLLTVMF